jgi:hypothetical protein
MNRKEEQKEREMYIFGEFVKICPLEIISFESKDPPEPDILCQLNNGSSLAFELVEAVDNKIPHKDHVTEKSEELWNEYYNYKLSQKERDRFDAVFSGCSLSLSLTDHATEKVIEKAIPLLFKRYKNSCRDQLGLIHHEQAGLPKGCERIRIEPQEAKPTFRCSRASHISSNFIIERLKSKFGKTYETNHSIHLLVYNDHHPFFLIQSEIKIYIEQNINSSQFERIWFFDRRSGKKEEIVYVFP